MLDVAQIAVGFSRFMRGFTYRTEEFLSEWYFTTLQHVSAIRGVTQRFRDTGNAAHFPPNFTACGNYGGCEFREVCSKSPQYREQFLKSNFEKRRPWNPLESR
jgi:hypothetical protein